MKNRITSAVAVYLVLENKLQEILIARRCNTGYQDGMYQVPAGHLETGELPTEALIREAWEEVGIKIKPQNVHLVHVSARPKHDETGNRIDLFFLVRHWKGKPKIMEPDKCNEIRWCSIGLLPQNMTPHVELGVILASRGFLYREYDLRWIKSHSVYGIK